MKRIVITGSTRGIGRALAERFMESGWSVVINGRNRSTVDQAVLELLEHNPGGYCRGLFGDVRSAADMRKLWDLAASDGPVDVWINNAGIDQTRQMIWDMEPDEIRSIFDVNVLGSLIGTQAAVRGMSVQGLGIIYLMEGLGSSGMVRPGISVYGASKAALTYLVKALSAELRSADLPVKIGAISPGMVVTDLLRKGIPEDPDEARETKRIFNILSDTPQDVSAFIRDRIIRSRSSRINWLTGRKIAWRFATAAFRKRDLFND